MGSNTELIEFSIKSALKSVHDLLNQQESAELETELLLAKTLACSREHLYTWPEQVLTDEQYSDFQRHCLRRQKGHPIAYLTGRRAFWDLEFKVDARVLIPRPETELLVELALEKINAGPALIADLGTGSGAIAITLAKEKPNSKVIATDLSAEALEVASSNVDMHEVRNVELRKGVWCSSLLESGFDVIVSNPPYIDAEDVHLSEGDVRFEPELALVSADNGMADIKLIAEQSKLKLKPGGWLLLEHGFQQGSAVEHCLLDFGYKEVRTVRDLSANDRVTLGRR